MPNSTQTTALKQTQTIRVCGYNPHLVLTPYWNALLCTFLISKTRNQEAISSSPHCHWWSFATDIPDVLVLSLLPFLLCLLIKEPGSGILSQVSATYFTQLPYKLYPFQFINPLRGAVENLQRKSKKSSWQIQLQMKYHNCLLKRASFLHNFHWW